MSKEAKIGLLLVTILIGAVAVVMYKKLDKNNATLASLKQAVGLEGANAGEKTPDAAGGDTQQTSDAESSCQHDELDVAQSEPPVDQTGGRNDFRHGRHQFRDERTQAQQTASTRFDSDRDPFTHSDDTHQTSPQDQVASVEQSDLGAEQRHRRRFDFSQQDPPADRDDRFSQARHDFSQLAEQQNDQTALDQTAGADTEMKQNEQNTDASQNAFNPFGDSDTTAQQDQVDSQQQADTGLDSQNSVGQSQEFGDQAQLGNESESRDYGFSRDDEHRHRRDSVPDFNAEQTPAGSETVVQRRTGRPRWWSTGDLNSQSTDDNSQTFQQPTQTEAALDSDNSYGQTQQESTTDTFSSRSRSHLDSKYGFSREATATNSSSADQSSSQDSADQQTGTSGLFERRHMTGAGGLPKDSNVTVHVVQPNDSYWAISKQQYGTARYFTALERYNRARIPDAKQMRPGMKVLVPERETLEARYPDLLPQSQTVADTGSGTAFSAGKTPGLFYSRTGEPMYRIGDKDTLTEIAAQHLGRSSRWVQVYEMNRQRLKNPDDLKVGMVLRLPSDASRVNLLPR